MPRFIRRLLALQKGVPIAGRRHRHTKVCVSPSRLQAVLSAVGIKVEPRVDRRLVEGGRGQLNGAGILSTRIRVYPTGLRWG